MVLQPLHQLVPPLQRGLLSLLLQLPHQRLLAHRTDEGTLVVAALDGAELQLIQSVSCEVGPLLSLGRDSPRRVSDGIEAIGI
jgi:hypothetical protein